MKPSLAGNLANQKYEASRNIERHLKIISGEVQPTWETSRWRKYQPDYNFHKQKGRMVVEERKVNHDNNYLSERIHEIVNEKRQEGTHQYAPGWRVGRGGTCIDCYPSESHALTMRNMANAQALARNFAKGLVEKSNVQVHNFINSAKSSYQRKDHEEFYKKNRVVYKIFMDRTPVTSLHLGLVKMAKKNMARRKKISEMLNKQIEEAHKSQHSLHAPSTIQEESEENDSPANGDHGRPHTAPMHTEFSQEIAAFKQAEEKYRTMKKKEEEKTKKKLTEVVATISKPEDLFSAKEAMREIRNRNSPWDNSTNDNYINSDRNDVQQRKAHSIWQDPPASTTSNPSSELKKRPHTASGSMAPKKGAPPSSSNRNKKGNYLDDRCPNILEMAATLEQQERERNNSNVNVMRSKSSSMNSGLRQNGYVRNSFNPSSSQDSSQQAHHQTFERQRPPLPVLSTPVAHNCQDTPGSPGMTPFVREQRQGIASPFAISTEENFLASASNNPFSPMNKQSQLLLSPTNETDNGDIAPNEIHEQTDELSSFHQQRLRKLHAMRKNVSFVENINVIEFDENNKMITIAKAAQVATETSESIQRDQQATTDTASITSADSQQLSTGSYSSKRGELSSSTSSSKGRLSPIKATTTDHAMHNNRVSPKESSRQSRMSPSSSASGMHRSHRNHRSPGSNKSPLVSPPGSKKSSFSFDFADTAEAKDESKGSIIDALKEANDINASADSAIITKPLRRGSSLGFIYNELLSPGSNITLDGNGNDKNNLAISASPKDKENDDIIGVNTEVVEDDEEVKVSFDGENYILNVEDILRALKPHDEFLLDFHLDISSKFPFFVRKDGLVSQLREYENVPLSYCDNNGKEVAILPVKVEVMVYDIGYILSGGANTTNMFCTPVTPATKGRPMSADSHYSLSTLGTGLGPFSPFSSRPVSAMSALQSPSSHAHLSHTNSMATFPTVSPSGQIRLPKLQRLSMTLASLRNHPVGLPTTAGILVAVRVIECPGREEVPKEVLDRGAYRDFTDCYGYTFMPVSQLARRKKAFPRDASVLTVLHEMQSFAYPYSGIDQILKHNPQQQHLQATNLVNASTNRLNRLLSVANQPGRSTNNLSMRTAVAMGSAGTESGAAGRRALSAGDKHRLSNAGVSAAGFSAQPTSFAGQHVLTIDEGQKHAIVYPCLLDMCDAEAIESLIQPILSSLRLEYEENEEDSANNSASGTASSSVAISKAQSLAVPMRESLDLKFDDTDLVDGEMSPSPVTAATRMASAFNAQDSAGNNSMNSGTTHAHTRKKRASIRETIEMIERGDYKALEEEAQGQNGPVMLKVRCL